MNECRAKHGLCLPCNMDMVSIQSQTHLHVGHFRKPTFSVTVAGLRRKLVWRQPFKMIRACCPEPRRVLPPFTTTPLPPPITLSTSTHLQPYQAANTKSPLLIHKTRVSSSHPHGCLPSPRQGPTVTPTQPALSDMPSQIAAQLALDESFTV